jgi:hypothetical protein
MGVEASKSSNSAYSATSTAQSRLADKQTEILENREKLFNDWYLPTFKNVFDEFDPNSAAGNAAMNLTAKGINSSFDTAQKQTGQTLAQMNLLGTGAGTALTAANNRARASALADAYANQLGNSTANKAQMLNSMSGLMPSTTTAAPTLSFSQSSSHGESSGTRVGL